MLPQTTPVYSIKWNFSVGRNLNGENHTMEKLGISMQKICSQGITVLAGYTAQPLSPSESSGI